MARLRHFAVCVKDLDKAAEFYASVFDLKRVGREDLEIGSAIYMTDGVINLALLNFKGKAGSKASDLKEGTTFVGAHHFGFQVDDLVETQQRIEANGGKFFFDLGDERRRPWLSRARRSTSEAKWCAADPGPFQSVAVPDQRCTATP